MGSQNSCEYGVAVICRLDRVRKNGHAGGLPENSVPECSLSGDVVVPVANCGVQEYNSNPKEHMPLRDYLSYWTEFIQQDYSSPRGCLYLKDWHLCR